MLDAGFVCGLWSPLTSMTEKPDGLQTSDGRRFPIQWTAEAIGDLLAQADRTLQEPYVRLVAVKHALKAVSLASWQLKVVLKELDKKVRGAQRRMTKQFTNDWFFDEPNGGDDDGVA